MKSVDAFSGADPFPSTQWDRLRVDGEVDCSWFCGEYRGPVLAYLGRRLGPEDAADLCQEFFGGKVIRDGWMERLDRSRGSLRSYLVTTLGNLVGKHVRAKQAQKRGGGVRHEAAVDEVITEGSLRLHGAAPDLLHDLRWAHSLLEAAFADTEAWCREKGREKEFHALRPLLDGSGPARPYQEIAAELGCTTGDVATARRRLSLRVGRCLMDRIEQSLRAPGAGVDEVAEFRRILSEPL
jgi:DNA-directed RNA polymerase specialized sigma24 family protein